MDKMKKKKMNNEQKAMKDGMALFTSAKLQGKLQKIAEKYNCKMSRTVQLSAAEQTPQPNTLEEARSLVREVKKFFIEQKFDDRFEFAALARDLEKKILDKIAAQLELYRAGFTDD